MFLTKLFKSLFSSRNDKNLAELYEINLIKRLSYRLIFLLVYTVALVSVAMASEIPDPVTFARNESTGNLEMVTSFDAAGYSDGGHGVFAIDGLNVDDIIGNEKVSSVLKGKMSQFISDAQHEVDSYRTAIRTAQVSTERQIIDMRNNLNRLGNQSLQTEDRVMIGVWLMFLLGLTVAFLIVFIVAVYANHHNRPSMIGVEPREYQRMMATIESLERRLKTAETELVRRI